MIYTAGLLDNKKWSQCCIPDESFKGMCCLNICQEYKVGGSLVTSDHVTTIYFHFNWGIEIDPLACLFDLYLTLSQTYRYKETIKRVHKVVPYRVYTFQKYLYRPPILNLPNIWYVKTSKFLFLNMFDIKTIDPHMGTSLNYKFCPQANVQIMF